MGIKAILGGVIGFALGGPLGMQAGMAALGGAAIGSSLDAADQQSAAGAKAADAGEAGAQAIEEETRVNILQARKSQARTLGIAKAITAASGIKFDASKINRVRFTEGGVQVNASTGGLLSAFGNQKTELSAGKQIAGDKTGSSSFTYLQEMKKTFAQDIGWMGRQGRSRAKVSRMGGQIAQAQAEAGATASRAGAFTQAYSWWKGP